MASPLWDPKHLQIRTKSLEEILEPLVCQVTTLVSQKDPALASKKGASRKADTLCHMVRVAADGFIARGTEIAADHAESRAEMLAAVDGVRVANRSLLKSSREFADDPCSALKSKEMVQSTRALLSSLTHMLVLADTIDVYILLQALRQVEEDLDTLKHSESQQEVIEHFKVFGKSVASLTDKISFRQADLKDQRLRDDLASSRVILRTSSLLLLTASKAYVRHPEVGPSRACQDYAMREIRSALAIASEAAQARGDTLPRDYEGPGELASALDRFDESILLDPAGSQLTRVDLESRLESIVSGAAVLADSSCTREERQDAIVLQCNSVRQALQELLDEHEQSDSETEKSGNERLDAAVDKMCQKTSELRRQLRLAAADHVSDCFLETSLPLVMLLESARAGDTGDSSSVFREHGERLVEVGNLACSMSSQEERVKLVRVAGAQLEALCPQVVNAAEVLVARPHSKVANENMDAFKDSWERQVRLLTDAVDEITEVDDFLEVSEYHIREDMAQCLASQEELDPDTVDRAAGAASGRCARVCSVVCQEMCDYEPSAHTQKALVRVAQLRNEVMPQFARCVERVVDTLATGGDETDRPIPRMDRVSMLVQESVLTVKEAVLENKVICREALRSSPISPHMSATQVFQNYGYDGNIPSPVTFSVGASRERSPLVTPTRAWMKELPEVQKAQIAREIQVFHKEKLKLDEEIAKWDSQGNEIILLAKQMCLIMMEMTDFTRGQGPLYDAMDVIEAAKRISDLGTRLHSLCQRVSDNCPDSASKEDLAAYQQRITLCCHQLDITSKVKAEVQELTGGEVIVTGLDSATSLITSAKNLMNAVVLAVKASYVASTKYRSGQGIVRWRMQPPAKKALVGPTCAVNQNGLTVGIKADVEPVNALSEFDSFV